MRIVFNFKNFDPSDHLRKYAKDRFGKLKLPGNIKLIPVATLSQAVAALHLLARDARSTADL